MVKLDFCTNCNKWISANEGQMRQGPDGEAEIVCEECLQLERNQACPVSHDSRSGTLDDE